MNILSVNEQGAYRILGVAPEEWSVLITGVNTFRDELNNGNRLRCRSSREISERIAGYAEAKDAASVLENYLCGILEDTHVALPEEKEFKAYGPTKGERARNLALKAIARPEGIGRLITTLKTF